MFEHNKQVFGIVLHIWFINIIYNILDIEYFKIYSIYYMFKIRFRLYLGYNVCIN